MKAKVHRSSKREFICKLSVSGKFVSAKALGNLLKGKECVVVGDIVELELCDGEEYQITRVYDRENEIFRIQVREAKKKIVAANCDVVVILISVSKPEYKRGIVDRFIIRALQWEVAPIIVFNKMDEFDNSFDIEFERDRLKDLGIECFEISAKHRDYKKLYFEQGMSELKELLRKRTSIFLGQSGVGKSKTISALTNGKIELKTKRVGKSGKGTHTTTWSEIIEFEEYSLIDSPGIRSLSLDDINPDELLEHFPDIVDSAVKCKFADCKHNKGASGCFFMDHVDRDSREGKLILSRLDSYISIKEELSRLPFWKNSIR